MLGWYVLLLFNPNFETLKTFHNPEATLIAPYLIEPILKNRSFQLNSCVLFQEAGDASELPKFVLYCINQVFNKWYFYGNKTQSKTKVND